MNYFSKRVFVIFLAIFLAVAIYFAFAQKFLNEFCLSDTATCVQIFYYCNQ